MYLVTKIIFHITSYNNNVIFRAISVTFAQHNVLLWKFVNSVETL